MTDRDDFGAFLIGFVVGGLTGAVVALLFAPQTGEETRTLLKEKSIELRDKASQTAEETLARAEAAAADARASYEKLAKEVRTRGEEVVQATKKAVSRKRGTVETGS
ncbi:MAG: YtxH domain-containing protein [Anaerolineales bacterium]|nr:YtxH domain-containing protein [Anaerolineales bacterium]MDP3184936.1 YtxH domain-containing protein [Anaerolineales bacterium]